MNAGQGLTNLRTLCGMIQLQLRKLADKPDGWVPAIECGRHRAYLTDLDEIWQKVTALGYKISRPTGELEGLRRGNAPQSRPPLTLKQGVSQADVLLASDDSAIGGFGRGGWRAEVGGYPR